MDLNDFAKLSAELKPMGWSRETGREHRWRTPAGTLFDLLPAGKALRESGKVIWPESGIVMSLTGFDHVFSAAVLVEVSPKLSLRVIPPVVLMLLKIAAFLDRPHEREKDLEDIRHLLTEYEAGSERIFSEAFGDGPIRDYALANAFLLGQDLRKLCNEKEADLVRKFIALVGDEKTARWWEFVRAARDRTTDEDNTRLQLETFSSSFGDKARST
ncbi:MAG TPA: hypothetical protein VI756_29955 [Blastocatellia bacterium]